MVSRGISLVFPDGILGDTRESTHKIPTTKKVLFVRIGGFLNKHIILPSNDTYMYTCENEHDIENNPFSIGNTYSNRKTQPFNLKIR